VSAYQACFGLTSVTIPSSVTSIGTQAFFYCRVLKEIKVQWQNPLFINEKDEIFKDVSDSCLLKVPKGTAWAYRNSEVWKNFRIVEYEENSEDITVIPSDDSVVFEWMPNADATYYHLVVYTDSTRTSISYIMVFDMDGEFVEILRSSPQVFSHSIENLAPGTTYYYDLRSYGADNVLIEELSGKFETTGETTSTAFVTSTDLRVYTGNGSIFVENIPNKTTVKVYNMQGNMVNNLSEITGSIRIPVSQRGIYLLQAGNKVYKVMVK